MWMALDAADLPPSIWFAMAGGVLFSLVVARLLTPLMAALALYTTTMFFALALFAFFVFFASIAFAEDRELFRNAMRDIGLECPRSAIAHSMEEALQVVDSALATASGKGLKAEMARGLLVKARALAAVDRVSEAKPAAARSLALSEEIGDVRGTRAAALVASELALRGAGAGAAEDLSLGGLRFLRSLLCRGRGDRGRSRDVPRAQRGGRGPREGPRHR